MQALPLSERIRRTNAKISKINKNIECVTTNIEGPDHEKKVLLEYYNHLLGRYKKHLNDLEIEIEREIFEKVRHDYFKSRHCPKPPEFPANRS